MHWIGVSIWVWCVEIKADFNWFWWSFNGAKWVFQWGFCLFCFLWLWGRDFQLGIFSPFIEWEGRFPSLKICFILPIHEKGYVRQIYGAMPSCSGQSCSLRSTAEITSIFSAGKCSSLVWSRQFFSLFFLLWHHWSIYWCSHFLQLLYWCCEWAVTALLCEPPPIITWERKESLLSFL